MSVFFRQSRGGFCVGTFEHQLRHAEMKHFGDVLAVQGVCAKGLQ